MEREHKTDGTPCWCNPKIVKVLSKEQEELVEKLAEMEHQRWADWQKYVFSQSEWTQCGYIVPRKLCKQWQRQIDTPYSKLSEEEKDRDREQVGRYWDLISKL